MTVVIAAHWNAVFALLAVALLCAEVRDYLLMHIAATTVITAAVIIFLAMQLEMLSVLGALRAV